MHGIFAPALTPAHRFALAALVLSASLSPSITQAQLGMPVSSVGQSPPRVDGMLRDWRGVRFSDVGHGDDASMRYALAWDDTALYVAAEVRDQRMVRESSPTTNEDAIILTLAARHGNGPMRAVEVYLEAGLSGHTAARTLVADLGGRPHPLRGASIVEAPSDGGYSLEAKIPLSSLGLGAALDDMRGAIRLRDVDSQAHPVVKSEPSSAPVIPNDLGRLPELIVQGGEGDVLRAFLHDRGIEAAQPRFSLRGEVFGGAPPEHVAVVGRYVVVYGRGYQEGHGYGFVELPISSADDVRMTRLVELTGDSESELLLRYRERGGGGYRELLAVFSFSAQGLDRSFVAELEKGTGSGSVQSSFRIERHGRSARVLIRAGEARNLSAENFRERPASDAEPILLPWGPIRARSYAWDGHRFARVAEEANPDYVDPAAAQAAAAVRPTPAAAPEAPALPGEAELLAALRRERQIPARVRPRLRTQANLVGDARPETLLALGSALVVIGPGYREGRGYFYYALPLERPDDLRSLQVHDLDGDGHAEILARVRQRTPAGGRDVLLVHSLTATGFPRLLAVEVAREEAGKRIDSDVAFARGGLELRAGPAHGFDAASWPYAQEASNGIDPPVLPWGERTRTYRLRGGRLSRQ